MKENNENSFDKKWRIVRKLKWYEKAWYFLTGKKDTYTETIKDFKE